MLIEIIRTCTWEDRDWFLSKFIILDNLPPKNTEHEELNYYIDDGYDDLIILYILLNVKLGHYEIHCGEKTNEKHSDKRIILDKDDMDERIAEGWRLSPA